MGRIRGRSRVPGSWNLRKESQVQVRAGGSCWPSHEGRLATARAGLTALAQRMLAFMKLLLGKGHFFSLLLGEVVMHCQEAVRGQEWDPPRPDTPTHRAGCGWSGSVPTQTSVPNLWAGGCSHSPGTSAHPPPPSWASVTPSPQPGPQARGPQSNAFTGGRLVGEAGSSPRALIFQGESPVLTLAGVVARGWG